MPLKKRPAEPLADRAVRAMLALRSALGDVVSLLEQVRGDARPMPIDAMLLDDVTRLVPRCNTLLWTAPMQRMDVRWLPDDIVQLILDFANYGRMPAVWGPPGADGVPIVEPPVNRLYCGHTSTRRARLVCKKWARIGGSLVRQLQTHGAFRIKPEAIVAAFPHVKSIGTNGNTRSKTATRRFERLIELYMQRGGTPIHIERTAGHSDMDVHGAYVQTREYPITYRNPALPVRVAYDNESGYHLRIAVGADSPPDYIQSALSSALPVYFFAPAVITGDRFCTPVVIIRVPSYDYVIDEYAPMCASLVDRARWIDGRLPRIVLDLFLVREEDIPEMTAVVRVMQSFVAPHKLDAESPFASPRFIAALLATE